MEEGHLHVPKTMNLPCFPSRSTAGPDAGVKTIALAFDKTHVKMRILDKPDLTFALVQDEVSFSIYKNGEPFIDYIQILPTLAHAPNHAFVNLHGMCKFGCSFCVLPALEKDYIKDMTAEKALRIFQIASKQSGFDGVAITSGIPESTSRTNKEIAELVRLTRRDMGDVVIGVEAYFEELDDIRMLKEVGANEIKINVESWNQEIFAKVCPNRDRDNILRALAKAVDVFGRGIVTSNLIIGLGETDETVRDGIETLAEMGVVASVRALRVNEYNRELLEKALGFVPEKVSKDRLLSIGKMHREILENHALTTRNFKTMCFSCQCCDIVPFWDI